MSRFFSNITILSATLMLGGYSAWAQTTPDTCDAGMMQSIEARADLEAQREVVQAESMIKRGDSVLDYSCFDEFLRLGAEVNGAGFSESSSQGATADTSSVDDLLQVVAGDALRNYIGDNFSHAAFGGEIAVSPTLSGSISGDDKYDCSKMNQVWLIASCDAFDDDDGINGFYTFEEYAAMEDIRNDGTIDNDCKNPKWAEIKDIANGETPWQTSAWEDEQAQSYFDLMDPDNCSNIKPLLTGGIYREISDSSEVFFEDAVCSAPGCSFDGGSKCVSDL